MTDARKSLADVLTSLVNREVVADSDQDPEQALKQWLHQSPDNLQEFRKGFIAVMNDPTQSFADKAWHYISEHLDEVQAKQRFFDIWKIATDEEWSWDKNESS